MMRVLILSYHDWQDDFVGRIDSLSENVDSIVIYMPHTCDKVMNDLTGIGGIEVREIGKKNNKVLYPLYFMCFLVHGIVDYYILNRYDVIHTFDYYVGLGSGAILRILTGAKLVTSIRGLPYPLTDQYLGDGFSLPKYTLKTLVEIIHFRVLGLAHYCIFKSDSEMTYYSKNVNLSEKCAVIPTGVDFGKFSESGPVDYGLSAEFPEICEFLTSSSHVTLFAGRLVPQKGVTNLINHVKKMDGKTKLVILGESKNEKYKNEIKCKIRNHSEFLLREKYISHERMPSLLKLVDSVSLLSMGDIEGNPKILQESLATGTPVIASNIDGIQTMMKDVSGAYLINPKSFEEYRESIKEIQNNNYSISKNKLKSEFDMDRNYKRIAGIYYDIV